MHQEIRELFEASAKLEGHRPRYITPHYWGFLENLFNTYVLMHAPVDGLVPTKSTITVERLCSVCNRTTRTYYNFVKMFYGTPGKFWDLMETARLVQRRINGEVEEQRLRAQVGPLGPRPQRKMTQQDEIYRDALRAKLSNTRGVE